VSGPRVTPERGRGRKRGTLRAIGLGLITGAADDDPSAIGTYASAGARFGPAFLWMAPVTFPMMCAVVYLSSKVGQVQGKGLFAAMRSRYRAPLVRATLLGVLIGNVIEAAADLGGMAAAVKAFFPVPHALLVVVMAALTLTMQIGGSYRVIRNVLRVLSLSLVAYVVSAALARPDLRAVLRGTFVPTLRFDRESLSLLVAVIGTTLSAYLYTWQSNEEVEEKLAAGVRPSRLPGTTDEHLRSSRTDIALGMLFSNVVMYFIILSTAATLFKAGKTQVDSAADAALALKPLAGPAAAYLFALGVVAVGFLAVPVMTAGAAYDLCQTMGWRYGLSKRPREARPFYGAIAAFTLIACGLNFFGLNPMRMLVFSGVVQGFSTPPLMLLLLFMTRDRALMGGKVNSRALNVLAWLTTAVTFAASGGLVASWLL
jgi:NRAMP (natural resistance-associated macrophage protein)-like metal ion transporter